MKFVNYIDGSWVPSVSGKTFQSINPATGEVIGEVTESTPADVDAACAAAVRAFDHWRQTPVPRRAEILSRAGEILFRRQDELARLMTMEMGKILRHACEEVRAAIDLAFFTGGEGRRSFGYTTPSTRPDRLAVAVREPVGTVGVITPWSFPLAIPGSKIFPALVLGNTVVFKPSCATAMTSAMIVHVLEEAGLPAGVLNLVHGTGPVVGAALAKHPNVALVSFTGSTEVGRQLAIEVAPQLKRLALDLDGQAATIVLDDADLDLAAEWITWNAFAIRGQRCAAASRIVVQRTVHDRLVQRLVDRSRRLRLGNGLDPGVDLGPLVSEQQLEQVERAVKIGLDEGAKLLIGGHRATEDGLSKGYFFEPTILDEVQPTMRVAREEIFGPVVVVMPVESLEEAIAVSNAVADRLCCAIYGRDVNRTFRATSALRTGLVMVNPSAVDTEGFLLSMGLRVRCDSYREAGVGMLDVFSEWKTLFVDYAGRRPPTSYQ